MKVLSVLALVIIFSYSCSSEQDNRKFDPVIEQMMNGSYNDTNLSYQEYINQNYQVFAMPLPKEMTLFGERVPLDKLHVRDQLDREILVNTYWHSNTFLFQKRAARWFPSIERILKQEGVHDDMKYLAVIESGLDNVVSPAGATGFWQFMKGTGEGYGLEINQYVDERYHLEKATRAACSYMKKAYKMFGNWSNAAASYNIGKGALKNALEKQKVDTYYDLHLNKETSRYVYRILAAKLILSNSKNFGFYFRPKDTYEPYSFYTVEVDTTIKDLAQFAIDNRANYQILRLLNPWIRNYSLPNDGETIYKIKLPKEDFHETMESGTDSTSNQNKMIDSVKSTIRDTNQIEK